MSDDKGYDGKKEFTCVGCGTKVMLTKFASAKTAKCPACKSNGVQANGDIVSTVAKPRNVVMPSDVGKSNSEGKPSKCVTCGEECTIGKFASHKTALCDNCKGSKPSSDSGHTTSFKIDRSKIDRSKLPDLEDMYVMPQVIGNEKLRHVECPACHSGMDIVKINDSSPMRGLIILYQCKSERCRMIMQVSEQTRFRMMPSKSSDVFNYRGDQILNSLSPLVDGRLRNSIEYLIKLLDDNGIPIDGSIIPDELRFIDMKTVKSGFTKEADIVNEMANRNDDSEFIDIGDSIPDPDISEEE